MLLLVLGNNRILKCNKNVLVLSAVIYNHIENVQIFSELRHCGRSMPPYLSSFYL
uniref:Uncharacterized protein n=1 Tax=Arundo donax TaxID=35708 RepID=A0A0A9BVH0_ARUDO